MCIEFQLADQRMKQWANWLHDESVLKKLGYPTHSSEQQMPGAGQTNSEKNNPEAEEVEKLLIELKYQWAEIYQAIMAYHFMGLSMRAAAEYNGISVLTYQKYYLAGMGWLEGKLS